MKGEAHDGLVRGETNARSALRRHHNQPALLDYHDDAGIGRFVDAQAEVMIEV